MNARGFVLIEWLIASALIIAIAGAIFAVISPVRQVIERTQHRIDLIAAARGALELIASEMREAGSGPAITVGGLPLNDATTPVLVLDHETIRLVTTPQTRAEGRLGFAAAAGATLLQLDTATRCAMGPPACGFERGHRALVITAGYAEMVAIDRVLPGAVIVDRPVADALPAGSTICRVLVTTIERHAAVDHERLVRVSDGGAEQPLVDHVVAWRAEMDHPDPTLATRVSVQLRLQAPSAELRGPAGHLFRRAGVAADARHWVPDLELRADIAFRNPPR